MPYNSSRKGWILLSRRQSFGALVVPATPVPEPAGIILLGTGVVTLIGRRPAPAFNATAPAGEIGNLKRSRTRTQHSLRIRK